MSDIFYDRRGHEKYADEIIPLHQKGYFAILVKDEKVLVTYPPQVSVPEFSGRYGFTPGRLPRLPLPQAV